jgi:hypothetical protein
MMRLVVLFKPEFDQLLYECIVFCVYSQHYRGYAEAFRRVHTLEPVRALYVVAREHSLQELVRFQLDAYLHGRLVVGRLREQKLSAVAIDEQL